MRWLLARLICGFGLGGAVGVFIIRPDYPHVTMPVLLLDVAVFLVVAAVAAAAP